MRETRGIARECVGAKTQSRKSQVHEEQLTERHVASDTNKYVGLSTVSIGVNSEQSDRKILALALSALKVLVDLLHLGPFSMIHENLSILLSFLVWKRSEGDG